MASTAVATKIVGKALYLELVGDTTNYEEAELRQLLGWQHDGTKQVLIFPEYQDDTGKVYGAVVMDRIISSRTPKAQWDTTYVDRLRPREAETTDSTYVNFNNYSRTEWDSLTEREKFESSKRGLGVALKNAIISSTWAESSQVAKQAWVVREDKPIAVEITDQDMIDLHLKTRTPQAVIRRINKVRDTLDKFPEKLA